jgi:hypothetical protein
MKVEIETVDSSTGYELCIFPTESRRKRASWIMWVSEDGSGVLYTQRAESGAVQGEGLALPANADRKSMRGKKV